MKRSSFQFSVSGLQRAFWSFAIAALGTHVRFSFASNAAHGRTTGAEADFGAAAGCDHIFASFIPKRKRVTTVDDYFGTKVADPYRWLEADANEPEVASWVESQNKVTFGYLEKIPYRQKIKERLTQLFNYAKYTSPVRRGEYFFYTKNDGLQNQIRLVPAKRSRRHAGSFA